MSGKNDGLRGSNLNNSLFLDWLSGGSANAITSAILHPMDVSKTRMQATQNYERSVLSNIASLYRETGNISGLWRPGLTASMLRELLYSGPRAGFYVPLRDALMNRFDSSGSTCSLFCKILTAMCTGTLGAILANPADVIKIRLMVNPHAYSSVLNGFHKIIKTEGISGLYKGVIPSTLRGAFIAAGELATYDHTKELLKFYSSISEGFTLHAIASLITGLVATTVAAPFDMIKTRAMNSTESINPVRVVISVIRYEGTLALFRGWLPAYLRLGPHALICFPLLENIRYSFGLKYI